MGVVRPGLERHVSVLEASGDVDGELDGFGLLFGVTSWAAEVIAAWLGAGVDVQAPVEQEVAFDVDTDAVRAFVGVPVLGPVAVLRERAKVSGGVNQRYDSAYALCSRENVAVWVGDWNDEPLDVVDDVSELLVVVAEFVHDVDGSHDSDPVASACSCGDEDNWKSFLSEMLLAGDAKSANLNSACGSAHSLDLGDLGILSLELIHEVVNFLQRPVVFEVD